MTTIAMARLGKVYGNRMTSVATRGNAKLRARGLAILREVAGVAGADEAELGHLLDRARGRIELAALMHRFGIGPDAAAERLERAGGLLREALAESNGVAGDQR